MIQKGICIGIETPDADWPIDISLIELKELCETAGLTIIQLFHQKRERPNKLSYIGKGKLTELIEIISNQSIEVAIFDDELTPLQQRKLEDSLKIKILDRTSLVLDIFSQRAQTKEAQIQIELAQLQYLQPRLRKMWTHLSRLGGGIGTRGPGETQLEVDRRQVNNRIKTLKQNLNKVQLSRKNQRKNRVDTPYLTIAIMGYTNAGKSTIHHQLTNSNVLIEDKLFATLDPTTRKLNLPNNDEVLITDTVGFIRKLPHQLVNAFKSTLEEVIYADLILHIIDCSNPKWLDLMKTSHQTLKQLDLNIKHELIIFNKIDLAKDPVLTKHQCKEISPYFVSAINENCSDYLLPIIEKRLSEFRTKMTFMIPFNKMSIHSILHKKGTIIKEEHLENGIKIYCEINRITGAKLMAQLHSKS